MITILDGGMGRELHRRGAPFRQPEWSALALTDAPDIVRDTHLDFIHSGAQVITTNAYAVVPFHIGAEKFAQEGEQLAATAARLAREAVAKSGKNVRIAASLPPLFGSYRPDLFNETRAAKIAKPLILGQEKYVDLWLAETISSIAEARFIRTMLPENNTKPLWLSFTLDDEGAHAEPVLRSGETVRAAALAAKELGTEAMLFNCSYPEVMENAVRVARETLPEMPIGVYANAFEAEDQGTADLPANEDLSAMRTDNRPEDYLTWAQNWVNAGATMVGGCCGIAPEHIAALAKHFQAA
ncbi:homocysteine S-methyltransferase family protein [Neisseriaceae bacterium B1]